jgi:hypothetical protein
MDALRTVRSASLLGTAFDLRGKVRRGSQRDQAPPSVDPLPRVVCDRFSKRTCQVTNAGSCRVLVAGSSSEKTRFWYQGTVVFLETTFLSVPSEQVIATTPLWIG